MQRDDLTSDRTIQVLLAVGAAGLIVCAASAIVYPAEVLRGYLVGFLYWLGIAAGSLGILMVYHLTGGGWGRMIRRGLEAAGWTMPLLALLFAPLLFVVRHLYLWADTEAASHDASLAAKGDYLNVSFFVGRTVAYFLIWAALAYCLNKWSRDQDRTGDPRLSARLGMLSGPGLVLWGLAVTFAGIDWVMSLQPHFFSTIFGVVFGIGQVQAALALAIVLLWFLADRPLVATVYHVRYVNDLASLLLALVMFWAYVAFSQLLLIWSANLPEETIWYMPRGFAADAGGWRAVGVALAVLQFAVPFWLLLFPRVKRNLNRLAAIAGLLVVMAFLNLLWQVLPSFEPANMGRRLLSIVAAMVAWIGVGGLWLAMFLRQLRSVPLVAAHDLAVAEATHHA